MQPVPLVAVPDHHGGADEVPEPGGVQDVVEEGTEELVPPAPPVFSLVVEKRGAAAGRPARWRFIADHFLTMQPGQSMSYEDMALVVGLDFDVESHLRMVKAAARTAADKMLHLHQRVFEPVRGYGYEECKPQRVIAVSENHQGRALGMIETGMAKLATVDTSGMGVQQRRDVEAQRLLMGYQVQVMRSADIRSNRRQAAFDRLRKMPPPVAPGAVPSHVMGVPRAVPPQLPQTQALNVHPEG